MTDPIANMLTIIRNGFMAGKKEVSVPYSVFKENLAKILVREKFLKEVSIKDNTLVLALAYSGKTSRITNVQRVSKPGLKVYVNKQKLPVVLGGLGTAIISTPQGLMTTKEAKKKGLGGEIICKIW